VNFVKFKIYPFFALKVSIRLIFLPVNFRVNVGCRKILGKKLKFAVNIIGKQLEKKGNNARFKTKFRHCPKN